MIDRNIAECVSCQSRIVTRTQIVHKDRQEHSFPCPTCGVSISFVIDLDQDKGALKYRDPKNAKWVDSEEGAVKVLTFSDEIPVPVGIPDLISPISPPPSTTKTTTAIFTMKRSGNCLSGTRSNMPSAAGCISSAETGNSSTRNRHRSRTVL